MRDDHIHAYLSGTGEAASRFGNPLHPHTEKDKRHPAARVSLEFAPHAKQSPRQFQRQLSSGDANLHRVLAILRRRSYQVLPTGKRADGMDAAGLVLQERTWDSFAKILDRHFDRGFVV